QAEDGIRDRNVTGVQTCALPILSNDNAELLKEEAEVISVEVDEADNADSFDASSIQTESYAIDLMDVKKFHEQGIKGEGVKVAEIGRASCRERGCVAVDEEWKQK